MTVDDKKVKHLEFIQNIITRMNTNSFQIKNWAITIVSATLALYASTKNDYFLLVALFPAAIFWFLDAYYLQQERIFRGLYEDVAGVSKKPRKVKPFEMKLAPYKGGTYDYWNVFRSPTIKRFYVSIIAVLLAIFTCLRLSQCDSCLGLFKCT